MSDCVTSEKTWKHSKCEMLAPAGSFESLAAALRAGADAVYFGVGELNMRSRSTANFKTEDLPKVVRLCHSCGVKAYLTLNIIVYDSEVKTVQHLYDRAKECGVDAVIAADWSVIAYAARIGLPVHVSVQANIGNIEAVKFLPSTLICWCWQGNCRLKQSLKFLKRFIKNHRTFRQFGET